MQVSVLMTSFQHERYIARALGGVLEQTGVELELIVGDDASTDATRAVIAEYANAHPGLIRTFLPERNLGQGGKAIFGELVKRARGDFIAFLDGDDYWTSPDKLRRQVRYLHEHPECSMCFHNVLCVYEDEPRADEPYNAADRPAEVEIDELLDRCVVASCSPVFRRAAIAPLPGWYFELPWGDWPLYFMAARHGALRYLPELMGVYRIHGGGMYRGLSRLEALERRTAFYEGLHVPHRYEAARRRKLAESWLKRALEHNRLGERPAALRCLAMAARSSPRLLVRTPGAVLRRRLDMAGTSRTGPR